jgi:hypothetical protein
MFIAANIVGCRLDIKTRNVPTVSSINSLLSQYCKLRFFFANFYVRMGGGGRQLFALPRLSHGQRLALSPTIDGRVGLTGIQNASSFTSPPPRGGALTIPTRGD